MKLHQRIKRILTAATDEPEAIDVSGLSHDAIVAIAKELQARQEATVVKGDGKATFIEPMSESEYATWVHEEEHGWKKFYNRLTGNQPTTNE